jgi:uncharacterized protein DUF4365
MTTARQETRQVAQRCCAQPAQNTTSSRPCLDARVTTSDPMSAGSATLSANGRKARYGVSYLRNICNQAGVGIVEVSPDEDVLAVDCLIMFQEAEVRVQVKCTSTFKLVGGGTTSWPVEDHWLSKWKAASLPVYFVMVVVPDASESWITHEPSLTRHNTGAFWCRIDPAALGTRISLPKSQRLKAETLAIWHADLLAVLSPPKVVISR